MEYSIASKEIQSFYNNRYLHNNSNSVFSFKQDQIDMDVLKMSVDEWKTSNFKAHLLHINSQKDIQITGGASGEFAMLHFVCEGETQITHNRVYPSVINKNTNNLFCLTGDCFKHKFRKNQNYSYFKFFLPFDYIHSMSEKHPLVFGALSTMIKKQCPVMWERNLTTTLEMKMVLEQIKNASDMGTLAPFYLETKIQELLALQIQQISRIDYPKRKCFNHYEQQLNEARNIIENQYQNPPTIAQLAQQVGMSETLLKANFKICFNTTIYGYILRYRMHIAKKYLTDSSITISEIAYKSGYEHPSHFTSAFKRHFGISPKELRLNVDVKFIGGASSKSIRGERKTTKILT
ncbi:AraC family transcriptional regulator [Marinilabiliaceae bacterium JC017]|nr:AraC family transcriptional regulator [Marinilabiliaceae bacterium JC017]